ncbi:MAG: diguanylate cyclase [bacterium]|nr:diguanylate cyclase [bacterium]
MQQANFIHDDDAAVNGRVLVVDDIPANTRLLFAFLQNQGYEVVTASSGEEALDLVQQQMFDVILLDVMMPQLSGFDTCRLIKSNPKTQHIPVILVTSLNDVEDKVRGQENGADDFVTKPFNRMELLVRVKSMMRSKGLHDQLNEKIEELERAKVELRRLANTDSLTALFNKRYLEEFLQRELDRAARYDHEITLVMLDIDHFKRLNDTFGHQTGDVALKQIGALFAQSVRNIDLAARYGGEEFALVLLETGKAGAAQVAEKLRQRVAAHELLDVDGKAVGRLTVSMGIATYPSDAIATYDLIGAADRRLYQAKQLGRNVVITDDNSAS